MKCQAAGCQKAAIIDDDESDDALCLCPDHQDYRELVRYLELPEIDTLPQDQHCVNQRKQACDVYKAALRLIA